MRVIPVVCVSAVSLLLAAGAVSSILVPQRPPVPVSGVDVAVSAIAATSFNQGTISNPVPGKAFGVWTGTAISGLQPGMVAFAFATTGCNVQPSNDSPYRLPSWYAPFDSEAPSAEASADHPYIVQSIYRINAEGRLEQLGTSWTKHSWYAASRSQSAIASPTIGQDGCGSGICPSGSPFNNVLGSNCSDTYSFTHNSDRYYVGPRSEIRSRGTTANPGWTIAGSYLDSMSSTGPGDSDIRVNAPESTDSVRSYFGQGRAQAFKLPVARQTDISAAALGPSGRVIFEGQYVVNGDTNKLNNIAWRALSSTAPTTGAINTGHFTFASRHNYGPVVFQWGDIQATAQPTDEGTAYVSSRVVTQPDDGRYRYEYAVYNLDIDRGIKAVSLDFAAPVSVDSMNFNQPRQSDPAFDAAPWAGVFDAGRGQARWEAPLPPAANNPARPNEAIERNAVRWGTTYTYWFVSEYPPRSTALLNLTLDRAGINEVLQARVVAPRSPADITDGSFLFRPDGAVTGDDLDAFIGGFIAGDLIADITGDAGFWIPNGSVGAEDLDAFIAFFIAGS